MGYRVPLGENFITLRPVLQCSVTDVTDEKTGKVTVATPDMIRPTSGISRVAASVSAKFSQLFALSVNWRRETSGTDDEEEDGDDATQVTDEPGDNTGGQQGGQQQGGSSSSSSSDDGDNDPD